MSHKQRLKSLARRVGIEAVPLSHITSVEEFRKAAARLSDAQLMDALRRTHREHAWSLTDDELLAELAKARAEILEDPS